MRGKKGEPTGRKRKERERGERTRQTARGDAQLAVGGEELDQKNEGGQRLQHKS